MLLLCFFIPETYGPVLLQWKAKGIRDADPVGKKYVYAEHERGDWSLKGVIRRTVLRPIEMVMKEKILVFVTIYLSFVYGVLYSCKCFRILCAIASAKSRPIVFEALPIVFVAKRHFSVAHLGLIYIGELCTFAGMPQLIHSRSCLHRNSSRGCDLRLAP